MKILHSSWIAIALIGTVSFAAAAADAPAPKTHQPQKPGRQVPASDLEPAVNTSASTSEASKPAASPARASNVPAAEAPAGKPARVMDRLNLDATQVTGNSELPKVLYIVPWKRADLGDLNGRPMNSLLDEVLTPIDRDVFRRENRYYDALEAGQGSPQSQGTRDEK